MRLLQHLVIRHLVKSTMPLSISRTERTLRMGYDPPRLTFFTFILMFQNEI